jgi:hypothetical protein
MLVMLVEGEQKRRLSDAAHSGEEHRARLPRRDQHLVEPLKFVSSVSRKRPRNPPTSRKGSIPTSHLARLIPHAELRVLASAFDPVIPGMSGGGLSEPKRLPGRDDGDLGLVVLRRHAHEQDRFPQVLSAFVLSGVAP